MDLAPTSTTVGSITLRTWTSRSTSSEDRPSILTSRNRRSNTITVLVSVCVCPGSDDLVYTCGCLALDGNTSDWFIAKPLNMWAESTHC